MRRLRNVFLAAAFAVCTLVPVQKAAAETIYRVVPGDTLWGIARRHGVSLSDLVAANGIANPNLIYAGQELVIPDAGATPPATPPPPASAPAPAPTPVAPPPPSSAPAPGEHGTGSLLAESMIVSYYGNPYSGLMGVLGQLDKAGLVAALKQRAAEYEAASGRPVKPAIHFVATVAQAGAGADGLYRARMPYDLVAEYAQLAAENDMLFIIDLQFGRSTVQAELAPWLPLLAQPHVHLALDPEFDMWGGERPGQDLGHMTAAEINYATQVLAQLVEQHQLPNKVLMVYQFTASMLPDKQNIVDDPRVDIVVNMDGFGGQAIKKQHYKWYVADTPVEFGGIKLFLQHDTNLMSAAEVMAFNPPPEVVVYQ